MCVKAEDIACNTCISFISELTCHSPVTLAIENEDMLKILKQLHDFGPWDDSPLLLAHAQRFVVKSSFPLSLK